jgi:hypothetical protein
MLEVVFSLLSAPKLYKEDNAYGLGNRDGYPDTQTAR